MIPAQSDSVPELLVVVDTEEEFDWSQPFSRANIGTRSIPAQAHAQTLYERLGIVPTYVVGYPVATDPVAANFLRRLKDDGKAHIGAHLHAWVTPPHREPVNLRNSYQCNLPPALEHAKMEVLTEALAGAFGEAPSIFKAGRHGFGSGTARSLEALGYKIDCSMLPRNDLRGDGGPDFTAARDEPHWLEDAPSVLEVPVTTGYFGQAAGLGRHVRHLFDSRSAQSLRIPGLLGGTGLVTRSRLTPEGVSAAEQCRLLDALVKQGRRTFSLVYHSPSMAPGNTPYVRSEQDLVRFLRTIEDVATYFRDVIGGRFTTLTAVHARISGQGAPGPAYAPEWTLSPPVQLLAGATREERRGPGWDQRAAAGRVARG